MSLETNVAIGSIQLFAGRTAPAGYLLCDGAAVSRSTYASLFGVIGSLYGEGDQVKTFNLPNLIGRIAVGCDSNQTEFNKIGKTGGEKTHTLTVGEMPKHTHAINPNQLSANTGNTNDNSENVTAVNRYGMIQPVSIENAGGNMPHNNLQPYITLNYIIKY